MKYCRFCGSRKLRDASYETGVGSGFAVGLKALGGRREKETRARFPTTFCETCREIDVACSVRPLEAYSSLSGLTMTLYIPAQLVELLRTVGASKADVKRLSSNVAQLAFRRATKFLKRGRNPCRWRHMGYPMKVKIRSLSVRLHLILSTDGAKGKSISIRLAYGGGMAQCP